MLPATTPSPPYTAVIFTSQRAEGAGSQAAGPGAGEDGYAVAAESMDELARTQPGFLGIESARDDAGFGITVSYWRTDVDARAWKQHPDHLAVQRLGRERWYAAYRVRVARVEREHGHGDGR